MEGVGFGGFFKVSFSLHTDYEIVMFEAKSIGNVCSPSSLSTNCFWKILVPLRKGKNGATAIDMSD